MHHGTESPTKVTFIQIQSPPCCSCLGFMPLFTMHPDVSQAPLGATELRAVGRGV